MAGINKAILIGNVGRDAELRFTSGGTAIAKFSLATSEKFGKGADRQERTEWHRIVVWGKLAEFCGEYIKKGRQIFVEGRIQTREWDDKEGKKQTTTEIVANEIKLLGRRDEGGGGRRDEAGYEDASLDRMVDDFHGGPAQGGGADRGPAGPAGPSDLGPDDGELPF